MRTDSNNILSFLILYQKKILLFKSSFYNPKFPKFFFLYNLFKLLLFIILFLFQNFYFFNLTNLYYKLFTAQATVLWDTQSRLERGGPTRNRGRGGPVVIGF